MLIPKIIQLSMSKQNPNDAITQKFVLELNAVLAIENAGMERLHTRIQESRLDEIKQQLQQHLHESTDHQKRLQKIIQDMGGEPTQEKSGLPLPVYPDIIWNMMSNSMTKQEWELKRAEEDLIVENAEAVCYTMLIQKAKAGGDMFYDTLESLSLNLKDEQHMIDWINNNLPGMLTRLWPSMQTNHSKDNSNDQ